MDADDICDRKRLKKQLKFMERHRQYIGCATDARMFCGSNTYMLYPYLSNEEMLCQNLITYCGFCHPTLFINREFIIKNDLFYNEEYKHTEDVEYTNRILSLGEIKVIRKPLLKYRKHKNQITRINRQTKSEYTLRTIKNNLKKLDIILSKEEEKELLKVNAYIYNDINIQTIEELMIRIVENNKSAKVFNQNIVETTMDYILYVVTRKGLFIDYKYNSKIRMV